MPHGSGKPGIRAFLRDDKILIQSSVKFLADEAPLRIIRDTYSPAELEKIEPSWLKKVIQRAFGRRTCVQRADVRPFESEILIPRSAKYEETEQLWQGIIKMLEGLGHKVTALDQRSAKLRSIG